MSSAKWERRRKRLYNIIEVGSGFDAHSRFYYYENAAAILLNLTVTILYMFDEISMPYGHILNVIEQLTLLFFITDYIFRLFRINYYFDSLSVIAAVFKNAFWGIWWASSSLLTLGYGDIYPITTLGKIFGIFITFLGVGVVAIPTGIISAGFVEQYAEMKKAEHVGTQKDMHFIKAPICEGDSWIGKRVAELGLPRRVIMALIKRDEKILVPRGDMELLVGDVIIFGAEPFEEKDEIHLTEMQLRFEHPWVNQRIRDLDIYCHSIIILVKRKGKVHTSTWFIRI